MSADTTEASDQERSPSDVIDNILLVLSVVNHLGLAVEPIPVRDNNARDGKGDFEVRVSFMYTNEELPDNNIFVSVFRCEFIMSVMCEIPQGRYESNLVHMLQSAIDYGHGLTDADHENVAVVGAADRVLSMGDILAMAEQRLKQRTTH